MFTFDCVGTCIFLGLGPANARAAHIIKRPLHLPFPPTQFLPHPILTHSQTPHLYLLNYYGARNYPQRSSCSCPHQAQVHSKVPAQVRIPGQNPSTPQQLDPLPRLFHQAARNLCCCRRLPEATIWHCLLRMAPSVTSKQGVLGDEV